MNKGRWASIRLVARRSVCSAVDVSVILVSLPWSAITRLNLRRRPRQVYWSREQFGRIARQALRPRGLRPKAAEKRLVLQDVGHMGRRKYKSHLAVRPVEVPLTLRDYSSGSPEFEDDLQRPLSNVDGGVGGSSVI